MKLLLQYFVLSVYLGFISFTEANDGNPNITNVVDMRLGVKLKSVEHSKALHTQVVRVEGKLDPSTSHDISMSCCQPKENRAFFFRKSTDNPEHVLLASVVDSGSYVAGAKENTQSQKKYQILYFGKHKETQ